MVSSRERVNMALNHQEPDRVPIDLGASPVTGMYVSTVYRLRQALGLDSPGTRVKVVEPYQMSGEIEDCIEAGFDILNPVQCSAAGMDPAELKRRFGDRITFDISFQSLYNVHTLFDAEGIQ